MPFPPLIARRSSVAETPIMTGNAPAPSLGLRGVVLKNIGANFARVAAVSAVAIVLPSYLTHHLPVEIYAAWVLIIQLGAYVSVAPERVLKMPRLPRPRATVHLSGLFR